MAFLRALSGWTPGPGPWVWQVHISQGLSCYTEQGEGPTCLNPNTHTRCLPCFYENTNSCQGFLYPRPAASPQQACLCQPLGDHCSSPDSSALGPQGI